MIRTSKESIVNHFRNDLNVKDDDVVFLFSGVWGLGFLEGGIDTINKAFQEILPKGLLIIPTFSYSWCNGQIFDPLKSKCEDMGAFSNSSVGDLRYERSLNPNFSVSFLKNDWNSELIADLLKVDNTCFGENSIFGNIYKLSLHKNVHVVLFGGAFKDCLFRCTFIHYIQNKVQVPYRYNKKFYNPENKNDFVEQLVRYVDVANYNEINDTKLDQLPNGFIEDFTCIGEELLREKLLVISPFAYYDTRTIKLDLFCNYLESKYRQDIYFATKRN